MRRAACQPPCARFVSPPSALRTLPARLCFAHPFSAFFLRQCRALAREPQTSRSCKFRAATFNFRLSTLYGLEYRLMATSPIKFGTSGWRGLIADDFTFATVRLAVTAIAEHAKAKAKEPKILVGYDTRFYSEEFSQLAVDILQHHEIRTLLCETFTPTPAVAFEIMRRNLDGAINFTASHNPAQYHGLKFSSADAGPALPGVTKDIEARAAHLAVNGGVPPLPHGASNSAHGEIVNLRENYLKRLEEFVHFDTLRKAKPSLVVDALHACGASYLDRTLTDHAISVQAIPTHPDSLSTGPGPNAS